MMPEDTVLPSVATLLPDLAQMAATELKNKAEAQLAHLIAQGKSMMKMQSNLDLLMGRYHVGKSYMSQVVDWYAEMWWWRRMVVGVGFVAGSALVGSIFNLGALCAVLAIGFCYAANFFLLNHYEATSVRDERFCNDIVEMEKKLGDSIDSLNLIGDKLKDVLTSLASENGHLSAEVVTFQEQITSLSQQVLHFMEIVNQLDDTKEGLSTTNDALEHTIQYVQGALTTTFATVAEQSVALDGVIKNLLKIQETVHASTEKMMADQHVLFDPTFGNNGTIDSVIVQVEAYQQVRGLIETENEKRAAELDRQKKESHEVLAWVNQLLVSKNTKKTIESSESQRSFMVTAHP